MRIVAGAGFEPTTSGDEPDELPGCSTPQKHHNTQLKLFSPCLFVGLSLSLPVRSDSAAPSCAVNVPRFVALPALFQVPA
jgi:hypothetical protein